MSWKRHLCIFGRRWEISVGPVVSSLQPQKDRDRSHSAVGSLCACADSGGLHCLPLLCSSGGRLPPGSCLPLLLGPEPAPGGLAAADRALAALCPAAVAPSCQLPERCSGRWKEDQAWPFPTVSSVFCDSSGLPLCGLQKRGRARS